MLLAYINYPVPHVTIHNDPTCASIQSHAKPNQRYCRINLSTISFELQNFHMKKYTFASNAEHNDMWLEIDFQDTEFEQAVVDYICRILQRHYKRFTSVKTIHHCLSQIR